jgi:CheY-like chemotaxis protein
VPWRPRVLYVDERQGVCEAVGQLLDTVGCPCETVCSAEAALLRCNSDGTAIDLVITEHDPSRLDALELVENLGKSGFEGKIFVHSTRLTEEEEAGFARLTVDWLVVKPGGLADILQGLEEWRNVSALF